MISMVNRKTVLITGAYGFVGRHLTELLLDRNFEIFGLDILPASAADRKNKNYNYTNKGKASILWHYTNGQAYPDWSPLAGQFATNTAQAGTLNSDNTWTANLHDFPNTNTYSFPYSVGSKFDNKGNQIN